MFYEGLKAIHKIFSDTRKNCQNKNCILIQLSEIHGVGRDNINFEVITSLPSIKRDTSFSALVTAHVAFFSISYSLYKQVVLILILIDVKYLQNVAFSFKNGSNGQTQSSPNIHHQMNKFHPAKFPIAET